MYTKAKKTITHVTPQRPMTNEEKQARIMQFLQQRRESFSISILTNMLQRQSPIDEEAAHSIVDLSVKMADALIEKLYPMPKEEPKEETPVQTDFD